MCPRYVLIAEDEPDIARVLADAIGDAGYESNVIPNGALVPDAIAARPPDLLVLDVSLPGLSGLDIFDLVRSEPRLHGVPVLFLTASPDRAEAAFATNGVHRVMAKPFELDALLSAIREMIVRPEAAEAAA